MVKIRLFWIVVVIAGLLVTAQSCLDVEPTIKKPTLNVQMVQVNTNINFNFNNGLALAGNSPIDVNNINWSWLITNSGEDSLKEGQEFGVRFYLDYPLGNPTLENVILEMIASSKKIPHVGIISSGYKFISSSKNSIRDEEVNIYRYSFGQLKEGAQQSIILGGKVGAIGFSTDDTTPIVVRLLKEDGQEIVGDSVTIKIKANVK